MLNRQENDINNEEMFPLGLLHFKDMINYTDLCNWDVMEFIVVYNGKSVGEVHAGDVWIFTAKNRRRIFTDVLLLKRTDDFKDKDNTCVEKHSNTTQGIFI